MCWGWIAVLYFVTVSAYELRMMIEVTSVYLLEGTPIWAVMMSFMWVSLYLNIGGINSIARLNEIVMPITLVFFIVCIISSTDIFDIHNLLPVLGSGFKPVLQGIMPTLPAFMGFEILLIIIAFMKAPEKGMNALRFGIWIPVLINVITVVFVIGGLGIYATANTTFPTLTLVRSYEYPGLIFERFESLMLVIWIMQMFTSFSITHYAASLGCSAMFKPKRTSIMFVLLPLIYLLSMTPKDLLEVVAVGNFLGIFSLTLFGGVPPILLLISILRKKGKSRT